MFSGENRMPVTKKTAGQRRQLTPLWIISLFVSLTETVLGVAASRTDGGIQIALTVFVITFPVLVAVGFFVILWHKPYAFYAASEYGQVDPEKFVGALSQTRFAKVVRQAADLKDETTIIGNPDQFKLLFKVTGDGWKKSTKAMQVEGGCLVQVTTEQLNPDGSLSVAEAVVFVPGVEIEDDFAGEGRHLRRLEESV
jgi:hypothetical protein